jgi:hypothetical protein
VQLATTKFPVQQPIFFLQIVDYLLPPAVKPKRSGGNNVLKREEAG